MLFVLPPLRAPIGSMKRKFRTHSRLERRALLQTCLGALGLGCALRSSAVARSGEFRRLSKPVSVPLRAVREIWRPVSFRAFCALPKTAGKAASEVLLEGVLLRVPRPGGNRTELRAFCLNCPHELCYVKFQAPAGEVRTDPAVEVRRPLFVCPCHFSAFDPARNGSRISGPAPRGLYRFRVSAGKTEVQILEVEAGALT